MKRTDIFSSQLREEVEYFLLGWASYFRNNVLIGNLDEGVRLMMTESKEDFLNKLKEFNDSKNVLNYLENLKRYGKRPVTSIEITSALDGEITERAVLKQLERLKHWKQIKIITKKIDNKNIILYQAN